MIIAHYAHRLPADYDINSIRERARGRAQIWDAVPGLYFKAFLLRERGRFGASQNEYSSLYLWRKDEGFHDFLVDGRTKFVTESFGRPQIETRFTLDAVRGEGRDARFLIKQEQDIAPDADLTSSFAEEVARNRAASKQAGVVVAATGVDAERWKFTRVLLSEREPTGPDQGTVYQVLYLAQPLLAELPKLASRQVELATV
jgi:uncharacterized protein DUF4865